MFLKQTDATALVVVAFSIRKSGGDWLPNVVLTADPSGERFLKARRSEGLKEHTSYLKKEGVTSFGLLE